jgi:shikimate dehydrogenase
VISGATRVAAVIGDPVRHSLSPVLHNAAYRALGIDWVYVAFEVPAGATAGALESMRALGLAGISVTMPHKTAAADACDELSAEAAALHSVNTVTVTVTGRRLAGSSTDGEGFLRALDDAGCSPQGARALVLGAGGAARAVTFALGGAGARVEVCARRPDAAEAAARLSGAAGGCVRWGERADAAAAADVVVNATPIGMGDDDQTAVPAGVLHSGQVVVDLVYHPLETPLLQAARASGAKAVDGLGMLVHQAALQVEEWTGHPAPVPAMRAAAESALTH